ncbi:deglycase [Kocuria rhizophila]|uniref:Type 1 glutamine amidotransferase domain-containing protein n=2 Tax=Kocuria TaxID=57493 RepID=A0ABV3KDM6_9MICC|nr:MULTISPECIES: DJ-1/PfpI/YhbO family deglycase/protease [Kocuria]ASE11915.1 type 1 glutamine amidotransferase [Kocuria rhizophila]MBK4119771.1 type 1 glutamine amidotransferase [Kocuria rhizophila]MBS6030783.1 type 1 glutamine amidotransferase [Kocuria rhizophila]MCC5672056.1 type 1 glutamine amidotransferase [Kocuria rhizophila]MCC5673692.1 type 1 glutamine amidotransferase [Kocuria rhizophila]
MAELSGKKILVLVTNQGVEQDELKVPLEKLRADGAEVTVAAPETGEVKSLVGDWDRGETFPVDQTISSVNESEYDLLLLPGGTLNADALRLDQDAQKTAKAFASSGRPVAALCHGPWLLVETGLVDGKTLTSYPSVKTDIVNAGGNWVDQEVKVCPAKEWTLITSRNPGDLDAFVGAIEDQLTA